MNRYRRQVAGALDAAAVHPSGSCSWCGRRLARAPSVTLAAGEADTYLVAVLEQVLYESFYCPGAAIPSPTGEREAAPRQDPEFVGSCRPRTLDVGAGRVAGGGWRSGDDLVLRKDGLRVRVPPGQGRVTGDGSRRRYGCRRAPVRVPGFLHGRRRHRPAARPMVRLYFHAVASGAASLVAAVTSSLNSMGIAFRFKVIDAPRAVLALRRGCALCPRDGFRRPAARPLRPAPSARRPASRRTPALTKQLSPGIGLAEQPASGESFGEHRCRLLAEGIAEAHALGVRQPGQRLAVVEARFASRGIDLDAPYLERGSVDRYAL